MHAIIQTGGKQYRVAPGDVLRIEKLPFEIGSAVEFPDVRAIFKDGEVLVSSQLNETKVTATVTGHDRNAKIIVFKFKRKKQYKKTQGHRQDYTEVKIDDIVV